MDAAGSDVLDTTAGWTSLVCAVHCALLPIALALLPGFGLELLDNPWFDQGFALGVSVFGLVVLGSRLSVLGARSVLACYAVAVLLLNVAAFGPPSGIARGLLLAAGGAIMAIAHFGNREGLRRDPAARNLFRALIGRPTAR